MPPADIGSSLVFSALGLRPDELAARHPPASAYGFVAHLIQSTAWDLDVTHLQLVRTAENAVTRLTHVIQGTETLSAGGQGLVDTTARIDALVLRRTQQAELLRRLLHIYIRTRAAPGRTPPAPHHGPAAVPPSPPATRPSTPPPAR